MVPAVRPGGVGRAGRSRAVDDRRPGRPGLAGACDSRAAPLGGGEVRLPAGASGAGQPGVRRPDRRGAGAARLRRRGAAHRGFLTAVSGTIEAFDDGGRAPRFASAGPPQMRGDADGHHGWISEEPEQAPVGGFAGFILANRAAPGAGSSLGQVFARAAQARDREPEPVDPDDRMAAMVTRGYRPGAAPQPVRAARRRPGRAGGRAGEDREGQAAGGDRRPGARRRPGRCVPDAGDDGRRLRRRGPGGDAGTPRRRACGRQLAEAQEMIARRSSVTWTRSRPPAAPRMRCSVR